MSNLEQALIYSKRNWHVFPIKSREKVPVVKWADVATNDPSMVNGFWDNFPDANIGIACGERSGIVVLDIDPQHGGRDSIIALTEKHGALPKTLVSKTGSDGEHLFFKYPKGIEIRNSAGKLGKGLDIRANGGYVVGAGSIHPNGNQYEWLVDFETEIAEMPQWMIDILKEPARKEQPQQNEQTVVEGGRNEYLTKLAGTMRRVGFGEDAIFSALQIHNKDKCVPPLSEGEVYQIAHSIVRYEPQAEPEVEKPIQPSNVAIDLLEADIKRREADPREIWGIPYAWDKLSKVTGGKQEGELIYIGGEPAVGKSWFAHQDALFTAIGRKINLGNGYAKFEETPVLLWSGEMKKKQVYRRFFEMLGVPKRAMQTGNMANYIDQYTGEVINCWQLFEEAKAVIYNSPIYVADMYLDLKNVRTMLEREIGEHGIKQAVFDYDWLIDAHGTGEIEKSQNISRAMKNMALEFDLSIVLISSVNKQGMGQTSENVTKANLSGSGKKIHDADVVYILTKFNEKKNSDLSIQPRDYWKIITLHFEKARDMDYHIPNGVIHYQRETPNPKFREMDNQ